MIGRREEWLKFSMSPMKLELDAIESSSGFSIGLEEAMAATSAREKARKNDIDTEITPTAYLLRNESSSSWMGSCGRSCFIFCC